MERTWLPGHTQRVVIDGLYLGWQPVTGGVSHGSTLGPMLDGGIESLLTMLADDTELGAAVDTSEGRTVFQRHLDRPEEWDGEDCMKFGKDK